MFLDVSHWDGFNSYSIQSLTGTLHFALSEYELSRQRVDALTKGQETNKRVFQKVDISDTVFALSVLVSNDNSKFSQ